MQQWQASAACAAGGIAMQAAAVGTCVPLLVWVDVLEVLGAAAGEASAGATALRQARPGLLPPARGEENARSQRAPSPSPAVVGPRASSSTPPPHRCSSSRDLHWIDATRRCCRHLTGSLMPVLLLVVTARGHELPSGRPPIWPRPARPAAFSRKR